jgi:hypothetical protein
MNVMDLPKTEMRPPGGPARRIAIVRPVIILSPRGAREATQ